MPNHVSNDKQAGNDMYDHPKCFKEQCYSSFLDSEDSHIWSIFVGIPHQVPSRSGPYFLETIHPS